MAAQDLANLIRSFSPDRYWRQREASGTVGTDEMGNGNLTYTNTSDIDYRQQLSLFPGVVGARYKGTNGYAAAATVFNEAAGDFTFGSIIRIPVATSGSWVWRELGAGSGSNLGMLTGSGVLSAEPVAGAFNSGSAVNDNTERFVIWTRTSGNHNLYVDGSLVDGPDPDTTVLGGGAFTLGQSGFGFSFDVTFAETFIKLGTAIGAGDVSNVYAASIRNSTPWHLQPGMGAGIID